MDALALILLAAGRGRRFGPGDKLLHPWRGAPLLSHTVSRLAAAPVQTRVAVVGAGDTARRALLEAAGYRCVENPDPARGMGSSLACAISALPEDTGRVLVCLADMPLIPSDLCARLAAALQAHPDCTLACPVFEGRRGHPVLFAATHLPALAALTGDEGARMIIARAGAALLTVPVDDPGVLRDFDTPEAFADP